MAPATAATAMRRPLTGLLALVLLAGIVAYGVHFRLKDPLSDPVMGAEDPYSHVVFTKESLEKGEFGDSYHLGTTMYPPGLHAFLGVLVSLSGVDFYQFARFVPIAFGAMAIVGIHVLAARLAGRWREERDGLGNVTARAFEPNHAAGLAAALVTAVMPEHVFRTNLLFPTALDLAILPAFLLAFILAWEGAREGGKAWPTTAQGWCAVLLFAILVPPLAFTHPWVVPLFLIPTAAWCALLTFRQAPDRRSALEALATPAALVVLSTAFAMAFRWDESDTGFADFFSHLPALSWMASLDLPGVVLFAFLAALLGALAVPALLAVGALTPVRARLARPARLGVAALAAAALLALIPLLTRDLPFEVSYVDMLGRAAILLGLAGVVAALLRPSPLGDLALALSVFLFPLTALNIFDSPYWPQRTVAYLCFGVALLAGHLVGALHDLALARAASDRPARRRALAPAALVASLLLVATPVLAMPAPTYPWYRLYTEDQMDGFRDTVALLEKDDRARVVTHGWQPALMVKTFGDPNDVWYSPEFFKSAGERRKVLDGVEGPAYVVVDKYLLKAAEKGEYDLSFLKGRTPILKSDDGKFQLYRMEA